MGRKRKSAAPEQGNKKVRLGDPGDENNEETSLAQARTELKSPEESDHEEASSPICLLVTPNMSQFVNWARSRISALKSTNFALEDQLGLVIRDHKQPKSDANNVKRKPTSEAGNDVQATTPEHIQPQVSIGDTKRADSPAKDYVKVKEESGDTTPVRQREIMIAEAAIDAKDNDGIGEGEDTSEDEGSYDWLFESDTNDYVPIFKFYIENLVKDDADGEDITYRFEKVKSSKADAETPC